MCLGCGSRSMKQSAAYATTLDVATCCVCSEGYILAANFSECVALTCADIVGDPANPVPFSCGAGARLNPAALDQPYGWNTSRRALALAVTIEVSRYRKYVNFGC